MQLDIFTNDFKQQPYWWDKTPRPDPGQPVLPASTDVVIIGSGYTGLCAAIETARAGRSTLVIDAGDAGWGGSSRNGGLASSLMKPEFERLSSRHGERAALNILSEGLASLQWTKDLVSSENLNCDFKVAGKYQAAHNPASFKKIVDKFENPPKGLAEPGYVLPRSEQHKIIGTEAYHGGVVFENQASLDPARYHQGLLDLALAAEVAIVPHCHASKFEKDGDRFLVSTSKGTIKARDVLVATNGYTDGISPWLRRRILPIGSYMIATEALPNALMDRLMPTDCTIGDSRKVIYYFRPSPDRTRILFGGRVTFGETDPVKSAPMLKRDLVRLFPELDEYKVSHTWNGFIGYTFDDHAHVGKHDGAYYAMGYCGSGICMSSYLGTRVAQQLLGKAEGRTAFDGLGFPTRPFYSGNPWFLAPSVALFRLRDRINI
jgi:glycine/D-amino acid oxidase-like deaminating enzyme